MRIGRAIVFALFVGFTETISLVSICAAAAETPQSSVDDLLRRGRDALRTLKPDEAIAIFDSAIALDPVNAVAFFHRGSARMQKQDPDSALADIEKAISINPAYAVAYRVRGSIWSFKNDDVRAIGDFNRAIELDPNDAVAYLVR